jgi:hypothetical protein
MGLERLSTEQQLELLKLATRFKASEDISIEHAGSRKDYNADRWAIRSYGRCYQGCSGQWIFEHKSSSQDAAFLSSTRYPLHVALEIVNSPDFREKYVNKQAPGCLVSQ